MPETIASVGLSGLERRRANRLSGGQQQRLALAGVLAARPEVLVLDEPTANLDPLGAAAIFERLAAIRAERSTTIVLVEHRVEAAWPLADLVLALGPDGVPIDIGAPDVVLARSGERMAEAGIWLPETRRPGPRPPGPRPPGARRDAGRRGPGRVGRVAAIRLRTRRAGPRPDRSRARAPASAWPSSVRTAAGSRPSGACSSGCSVRAAGMSASAPTIRLAWRPRDLARRAGYVFQDPEAGFLAGTVADEVLLGLDADERAAAPRLMERLRLPLGTFGDRSPYRLSGGEARRLSLACALARHPRLLVLDEPTFGQDRLGYEGLLEILGERLDDGVCLVAATHDGRLVGDLASRIVTLDAGRITGDRRVEGVAA